MVRRRLKKRRSGDSTRSSSSSRGENKPGGNRCSLQNLDADSIPRLGHPHGAPTVAELTGDHSHLPSLLNDDIEPPSSQGEILSFIDALDHPMNIAEANEDLFNNNDSTLLSSAFSNRDGNKVEAPQYNNICNSLMGKIALETRRQPTETVAFPSTTRPKAGREARKLSWMGGTGATRKSGDGTVIPMSMIKFPLGEEGRKGGSERTPPAGQSGTRCVSDNLFLESAAKPENNAQHPTTLKAAVSPAAIQKRDSNLLGNREMQQNAGRIRIISDRGATIREMFDIDESNFIVGKLHIDDERAFVEKRSLAPPIDDCESDDSCVNVMRYCIVLDKDDFNEADSDSLERDAHGRLVAWISDRGRLSDDAYLILSEMS
ncbi:hypothetical protein THAOC_37056 [Thalassiosira oceanica]|uniref:Uncharacterized protein n=1 Tax=Thalassiosira oceanica TaxID=159749 RepID=K0R0R8_THAOC|nr:hypothetical protein THAOC_37056 [Thalassiosira oceanica]|eukprot:EJK44404.1 hypothetical protein THAOC_37056 [Thalassiosira oceanica]